jgi:hypothetical protein
MMDLMPGSEGRQEELSGKRGGNDAGEINRTVKKERYD